MRAGENASKEGECQWLSPHRARNDEGARRSSRMLSCGSSMADERLDTLREEALTCGGPLGFRTHALVCVASSLLMLVTVYQNQWMTVVPLDSIRTDPTRMAQGGHGGRRIAPPYRGAWVLDCEPVLPPERGRQVIRVCNGDQESRPPQRRCALPASFQAPG